MEVRAKYEWGAVIGTVIILFAVLIPAMLASRAERRDGIRRTELRERKTALEQINNEIGHYPLEYDATPHMYVVLENEGEAATAWYLRAELERDLEVAAGFDEEHNVFYRVTQDGDTIFYDICGGTYTCGVEREE